MEALEKAFEESSVLNNDSSIRFIFSRRGVELLVSLLMLVGGDTEGSGSDALKILEVLQQGAEISDDEAYELSQRVRFSFDSENGLQLDLSDV